MLQFLTSLVSGNNSDCIPDSAEIPNKTKVYSVDDSISGIGSFDYLFAGAMVKNRKNGKIIDFWANRSGHITGEGKIQARTSIDNGETWSAVSDIIDGTPTLNYFNISGEYDCLGRLHIFATNSNNGELHHYISGNDGQSFAPYRQIVSPDANLNGLIVANEMIEINGIYYISAYAITKFENNMGDSTESAIYCFKSSDKGVNWTPYVVRARGSEYVNESTIFHLGGADFGIISRVEATASFRLFLSSDYGETWAQSGADSKIGNTINATHPPKVRTMFMENTHKVLCLYYMNRGNKNFYVAYTTPQLLLSNGTLEGTFGQETKLLGTFTGGDDRTGYFGICHYSDNLEGKWSGAYEISIDEADRRQGTLPTDHYDTLKTSLGL